MKTYGLPKTLGKSAAGTCPLGSPQLPSTLGYSQSMPTHRASAPVTLRHSQSLYLGTRLLSPERQSQVCSHLVQIASLQFTHTSLHGRKEPWLVCSPKLTDLADGNSLPAGTYGKDVFQAIAPQRFPGVKPDSANPTHGFKQ